MRKVNLFIALMFSSLICISGNIDVPSKITDVTVFLTGAQVNRKASMKIPKGKSEIHLSDVTPLLVKESIQVKGIGKFTILSVNHQIDDIYSEVSKTEIEALTAQIEAIKLKMEEIKITADVYNKEIILIENTSHTTKNAEAVNIEDIKSTQNYYHTTLLDLKLSKLKLERELKELANDKLKLQQKLNSHKVKKSSTKSLIKLIVESEEELVAKFEISYFVQNAKWFPEYDARVTDISSPLTLYYKANISQQTGENWKDVNLTISTSNPNKSNRKPILKKWTVDLNGSHLNNQTFSSNYLTYSGKQFGKASGVVTDEYGEPIPFAVVSVPGSSVGTNTDFDGKFQLTLPKGATQLEINFIGYKRVRTNISSDEMHIVLEEDGQLLEAVEIVSYKSPLIDKDGGASGSVITREDLSRLPGRNAASISTTVGGVVSVSASRNKTYPVYLDKQVNVVDISFKADDKYTINSNSKYQVISIQNIEIPSNYQYYCAPKLDKDVFLTAQIVDWEKYNLLEGQVSVYYESTFMGTTIMDVKFVSDTLNVSIGRDKNIIVQREKIKELSRKKVLGNSITNQRSWKMQVKNNKSTPINILVEDQFPIPTNKQILVKHEETNTPKVDDKKGIVSWNFDSIAPSAKEEMKFNFSIKYPSFVYMELE